jgi:SAM-dependent methyltransferase
MKEWFESWFDTRYYHILYEKRDQSEAEIFIRNLVGELHFKSTDRILDLACGKGRHSIFLNSLGFKTTGVDLSQCSIKEAKTQESESLQFFVHDMRKPIVGQSFDVVMNLFTSFGYFDSTNDNLAVLKSIHTYLNPEGTLIIDFLNPAYVIGNLVADEIQQRSSMDFRIKKEVKDQKVIKTISFEAEGEPYTFQEKVQLLELKDFEDLLDQAEFQIETVFGNYQLEPFTEMSERLVIVAKKK